MVCKQTDRSLPTLSSWEVDDLSTKHQTFLKNVHLSPLQRHTEAAALVLLAFDEDLSVNELDDASDEC